MKRIFPENRSLYHGDCLDVMRGFDNGIFHLIATDPPFATGRDFRSFKDKWKRDDVSQEDWIMLRCIYPNIYDLVDLAGRIHSASMSAFLCWLSVRVLEMHRVLRDDGSLYLHCDHTAGAYIKAMLDAVFGHKNFRNEIAWCYAGGGVPKKDFPRKHDTIFRYSKTEDAIFNVERKEYGSHNTTGKRATDLGGTRSLDYHPEGTPINDWWTDIKPLINWSKERIGYPTQKPLKLYRRPIEASTQEGDVVFDPFCGCATTLLAAEITGRQWVGCDIGDEAMRVSQKRLSKITEVSMR